MYIMYVDESGRPELNELSNNHHFILIGLAIPVSEWHSIIKHIAGIKRQYGLEGKEIHTAWMARRYGEQEKIANFSDLDYAERREEVLQERQIRLRIAAGMKTAKAMKSMKINYKHTGDFIHLTHEERIAVLVDLADCIGSWSNCRLFAEAFDKRRCPDGYSVFKESFTQVVSRFEAFLLHYGAYTDQDLKGLIVQDDNPTEALRLTRLMKDIYAQGTFWRDIDHIVETPLFVDSSLTEMIQMADLCGYATRRFFEKNETDLFNKIYSRFDRAKEVVVGIRHYTGTFHCTCKVCRDHARPYS